MTDYIGYEGLTQAAMRGVVREALRKAVKNGAPPGDHHFYISFRTRAPGVKIADSLIEQFPEDMTIVIQHQFWDLEADDHHFEVILKFSGVPQHLSVPYAALTRFVDPSVNFMLTFEAPKGEDADVVGPTQEAADPASIEQATGSDDAEPGTVVNLDAFRRK